MMKACKCGSYAINHHCHGRDGSDDDLCDVCYWRKRAEQPAQQEPAGAVYRYGKDSSGKPWHGIRWTASGLDLPDGTLIYTSPPAQRTWVGLTDEDKKTPDMGKYVFLNDDWIDGYKTGLEKAEAKLKEKNA